MGNMTQHYDRIRTARAHVKLRHLMLAYALTLTCGWTVSASDDNATVAAGSDGNTFGEKIFYPDDSHRRIARRLHIDHYRVPAYLRRAAHVDRPRPPRRLFRVGRTASGHRMVPFMLIADMDGTLHDAGNKAERSPSARGFLKFVYHPRRKIFDFQVEMFETVEYKSSMLFNQRGAEFSELKVYNGRLLTPCDRTGIIYCSDGDGTYEKPFKTEWMTIKDGLLYTGGYGKEWTTLDGGMDPLIGRNPLYIKVVDPYGRVTSVDWSQKFVALRRSVGMGGAIENGYLIHEAVQWSPRHRRWFFLPRKMHYGRYDDKADEQRCAKILIVADEHFRRIEYIEINSDNRPPELQDRTRGFSTFQFVPGTRDEVIIAVKSLEVTGRPFESYITVFDIYGRVFVREQRLAGAYKFEGIEFIEWQDAYWN